jgi:hypothetical protein
LTPKSTPTGASGKFASDYSEAARILSPKRHLPQPTHSFTNLVRLLEITKTFPIYQADKIDSGNSLEVMLYM